MSLPAILATYQAGRLEEAEGAISAYLERQPDDDQAQQLGALIAQKRGDLAMAYTRIQAALTKSGNMHEKLNTRGNILKALRADIEAQASFEAALDASPDYDVARTNLAALLLQTGQPDRAAGEFAKLGTVDRNRDLIARGHVQSLIDANRPLEALEDLKTVSLSDAQATVLKARAYFHLGRFEDVVALCTDVIDDGEHGAESLKLSLQTLAMTGEWDSKATPLIEDVCARYPGSDRLHAQALTALQRVGDLELADAIYARAPKGPAVLSARAVRMVAEGDYAEAERLASAALSRQRAYPTAMYQLCFASLGLGKYDQAQAVADIALKSDPHEQFYWAIKATAGRAKGQDYRYYFDYDRFVRPYEIEAPQGWSSVEAFNADLKAELDALHGFTAEPIDQTLRLGTQTSPNLVHVDSPAIRGFFEAVSPAIADYVARIGRDPSHAFLRRNTGSFRIRSGWSVKLRGGGHHINHIHPDGWISSAYYVDVPDGEGKQGWIKFGEPPAPLNAALGQGPELEVQPKPGRLVLFPSYLWHGTYPIVGEATRMTLPIDILPAAPAP